MAVLANRKASDCVEWMGRCCAHLLRLAPTISTDEGDTIALCIWENERFRNLGPEAAVDHLLSIAETQRTAPGRLVPYILHAAQSHRETISTS